MYTSTTKVVLTTLAAAAAAVVVVGGTVSMVDKFTTAKRRKLAESGADEPEFITGIKDNLRELIEHATDVTEKVIKSMDEITASDYADAMLEANKIISAAHVQVKKLRELNARNTEIMFENVRKLDVLFLDIVEKFDAAMKNEPVGELSSQKNAKLELTAKKRGESHAKHLAAMAEKANKTPDLTPAPETSEEVEQTSEPVSVVVEAELLSDEPEAISTSAPTQQP